MCTAIDKCIFIFDFTFLRESFFVALSIFRFSAWVRSWYTNIWRKKLTHAAAVASLFDATSNLSHNAFLLYIGFVLFFIIPRILWDMVKLSICLFTSIYKKEQHSIIISQSLPLISYIWFLWYPVTWETHLHIFYKLYRDKYFYYFLHTASELQ